MPEAECVTFKTAHRCGQHAKTGIRRVWPIAGTDREEVTVTCTNCEGRRSTYERKRRRACRKCGAPAPPNVVAAYACDECGERNPYSRAT